MIHTTVGLYSNEDYKVNGVKSEHLQEHIEYNKYYRPGRGLFVDGKCIYKGNISDIKIKEFEEFIKDNNIIKTECTVPYH